MLMEKPTMKVSVLTPAEVVTLAFVEKTIKTRHSKRTSIVTRLTATWSCITLSASLTVAFQSITKLTIAVPLVGDAQMMTKPQSSQIQHAKPLKTTLYSSVLSEN